MIKLKNFLANGRNFSQSLLVGVCAFTFATSVFANPVLDLNNAPTGQVTIHQEPNSTVINQSSQQAIINWQSFNIGAQESTHFQQPAGGIALNRINPSQGVSEIYGRLTATGQIILVNPAGIFFGPGSYVNVGGLIASTANISNEDFLNHYYHFANVTGFNGAIINQGQIIAANNGLIALIGGAVSNEGLIQANVGHAVLASGNSFTMSFAGNELIGFSIDSAATQRAVDKNGRELSVGVNNSGIIAANGGRILISAKSAAGILDNVINMSGIVQARSVIDGANPRDGEIIILGDADRGVVNINGVLDASSDSYLAAGSIIAKAYDLSVDHGASFNVSSSSGDGGFIDTSGTHGLHLGNLTINTAAPNGKAGTWLIDPADINITTVDGNITGASPFTATAAGATLNVATLLAALANGDVIVRTTNDGFGGSGNITVSSAITWSSSYKLTLEAFNNIIINAGISGINGTLSLTAVNAAASITTGASGTIDVGNFNLTQGQWLQVGTLPSFNVRNSFSLAGDAAFGGPTSPARFLRAAGGDGTSIGTAYQLVDIYGIQGINSGSDTNNATSLLSKFYILANDIDATGTATWNNNQGFHPIGYFYATGAGNEFNGNFNGNNKVIDGLHINRSQTDIGCCGDMGSALFAVTWYPSIYNLGLTNVNITSQNNRAAGLVAFASWQANGWGGSTGASFYNNYVTGNVTSYGSQAGGLFGYVGDGNTINSSYSAATVTSINSSAPAGGLIAYLSSGSTVTNSYSTGTVRALGANGSAGGFVGTAETATTITNAYSSGLVYSTNGNNSGGFISTRIAGSTVNNGFWDTDTSLQSTGVGSGSTTGVTGGCFGGVCTNGGTANLALASAYTGWTIANSGFNVATAPGSLGTWLILDNQTRPMLWSEWNPSISNAHQLQLMSTALTANYSLTKNIDLSSGLTNTSDVWNTNYNTPTGAGFVPVGTVANGYTGIFNGNNFVIDRLYIQRANLALGLFGATTDTSTISNVGVTNISITQLSGSNIPVGGLAGSVAGDVTNAYTTGSVSSLSDSTGGLVGYINNGGTTATISNSYSTATVTSTGSYTGGLVGDVETYAEVLRSYAGGNVTGTWHVGGLVGYYNGLAMQDVYATGNVTGTNHVGGLVGRQYSNLYRGYSSGLVNNGVSGATVGGYLGSTGSLIGIGWFVTDSFWDSVTSGQTKGVGSYGDGTNGPGAVTLYAGCFAAGGACASQNISNATLTGSIIPKDLSLLDTYTTGGPTWNMTKTPSTNATAPSNTWYIFDATNANLGSATASSYTRPILMMEYQTNITNAHGLQLMGSTLGGNYTLANDIDMTNSFNNRAEIWGTNRNTATGYGFVAAGYAYQANANPAPLTQFVGTFNGNNHTISNLYVNKPHFGDTDTGGMFIETGVGAVIRNLVLMNANVTGAGQSYSTVGGLVGVMRGGTVTDVAFYGTVNAFSSGAVGGLIGVLDSGGDVLSNSSFNGTVTGSNVNYVGGLTAGNNGTISNSYSSGTVNGVGVTTGGLASTNGGTISNSYSVSDVNGGSGGTISGGLIGINSGTVNNSYSSGNVTTSNTTHGGFIGNNAGTVTNSVWDTVTSGHGSAVGTGSSTGIVGMTTTEMMTLANFTTPGNGFVTSAWNITSTPSITSIAPTNTWFIFDGATRPMLTMEKSSNIHGTHQLQMMGSALGGVYTLKNNIDFATTTAGDVWGTNISSVDFATPSAYPTTTGFVPIGNNTYNFNGSFDGQNYTINKVLVSFPAGSSTSVYSNFPSYVFSYQGFFGQTGIYSQIENIGITNSSVIGNSNVAGVVGYNQGRINNANYSGYVWGNSNSGGITGYNTNLIENSHNSAYVATHGNSGGIAGNTSSGSIIINSYNTGRMYVNIYNNFAGGLVGVNNGMIANSYNTGAVAGSGALYNGYFGGLVGDNYGHIRQSYNLGQVSGQFLNNNIGGIAGNNRSTGVIANTYNYGFVFTGAAISVTSIGGIAGANAGNITNAFSIGSIAPNGVPAAGIVGDNTGTVANAFWDINATSAGSGFGYNTNIGTFNTTSGGFGSFDGSSGVAMNALSTYCNSGTCAGVTTRFDFSNIWGINEGYSYPYLRAFYTTAPRSIVAISPATTNSSGIKTASLVVNGTIQDSTFSTGANGLVYMLEGYNNVSGVNNTIADNTPLLIYTTTTLSNAAEIAPVINIGNPSGSIYIAPGLMQTNTLLAGHSGTSSLNNTLLNQAIGSLGGSNSNIFYTAAGSDLTLKSSRSFASSLNTTYTVDGNIAATSGNITMNGPVVVSAASPTISTTTSGNINILNDVAGGGNTLTINTVGTTSSITGIISNLTSFTKSGTGTLTLSGASTFNGVVNVNAGTLSYSTIADVSGGASNLGAPTTAGNGTINIGATGILMYTGTGHSSNRVMNITADGGTINASGSGALTLTGGITGNNNNVVLTGTGLATESGDITNSAATLTKTGAGTWTLSGNNSYGTTTSTIITGGTLAISSDANLGVVPGAFDADNIQLGSGGTLQTNGTFNINSNRGLTLTAGGGNVQSNSGTLTYAMVVAGAQALGLSGPGNMILTSNITAPSSITSSANLGLTFSGTTLTASSGALALNSATTLTNSGTVTLTATGASSDITTGGLTWTGSNTVNLVAGRNIIINGAINGSSGSFNLTAANSSQSITTGASGSVNVNNFNLLQGQWYQNTGALPAFNVGNNFRINSGVMPTTLAQFIRVTSGAGTSGSHYVVVDIYGLQGIGSNATTLSQYFDLGANVSASSTINWNSGAGFVPIGDTTSRFGGQFNGQNYTINNLYINRPSSDYVGLFGAIYVGVLDNLNMANVDITGRNYVGAAAGELSFQGSAYINDTHILSGTVRGETIVGGLLGAATGSGVFNSSNAANVFGTISGSASIGGLVGNVNSGFSAVLINSYSTGNVTVPDNSHEVGGLAGLYWSEPISDSYSTGNVVAGNNSYSIGGLIGWKLGTATNVFSTSSVTSGTGSSSVGGLFGATQAGAITSSYSSGTVTVGTGSSQVGGFAGRLLSDGSINNSYSVSAVTAPSSTNVGGLIGTNDAPIQNAYSSGYVSATGSSNVGGFIGSQNGTITNSFWDADTSGLANPFGTGTGTAANVYAGCFSGTCTNTGSVSATYKFGGTTPANLSSLATYTTTLSGAGGTAWSMTATPSINGTKPGGTWFIFQSSTRPILLSEWSNTIATPHQVQLMGSTLGASYNMAANVDFYNGMRNAGEVWGTNVNTATGAGFLGVGNQTNTFTGSLNGNGYAINNLYINYVTAATTQKAGLFGSTTNASISNIGVSDANITLSGPGSIGILVGNMSGGSITSAYTSGTITLNGTAASLGVGGLVGNSSGNYSITNTYSTANVRATDGLSIAGGLIGLIGSGTITVGNSYSSGEVLGTNAAGFIGSASGGTYTFNNNFWDTQTSGQPSSTGATALTTTEMKTMSIFTSGGWSTTAGVAGSITSTASSTSTAPNYTWFIFDGLTRPMLMTENNTRVSNSHQVQMMGAALGKDYALSNNVYAAAAMDNLSEVWGSKSSTATGTGFVPISGGYSGVLNGNYYAIDGLYTKGFAIHGLFATTTSTAYIMNLGITGGSVTGGSYVAGLVGLNAGRIMNSYNTSTLNASGSYLNYMGGITGYNTGIITNSYNSGSIGTLADGGAFGTVGGVAGYNGGQISTSYNTGTINGLTGFNGNFGGVVGTNDTSGTITNSFNAGVVSASHSINATGFGGFVGNNLGTITNSLSYGYVAIPGGSNFTGGFAGINSGTITGSLWNTDTSGRASAVGSGTSTGMTGGCFNGTCSNGGTANLASNASPTTYTTAGWNMTNVWNVIEDKSYPYLRAFYTSTPRVVAGSSPASAGNTVNLAVNGTVLDTVTAGANGEFYFFAGYNNISGVNRAIADSSPALVYLTSGASVSNAVVLTPASTGSLSGTTSLTLTASTVTAGNNSTSGTLSNSLLRTALGSLSNSNILFAVDGSNNLTLNSGRNFQTSPTTAFTIDGNIAATSANIVFNSGATIGSSNPVISTTTSGNITFGTTVTGGGNPFTVSNPTSTTATFSGVISGSGTSLTKLGAGALTLSSAANSFTGGLFLYGGTLTTSSLPSAAGNSTIGTGNLFLNNGATLSYTGTTAIFSRPITINSGGGTIQSNNSAAHNLIITGGITVNGGLTFDTIGSGPTSISLLSTTLSGSGSITKTGSGILTFGANNTSYNGTITVSQGTLQVGTGNSTGTLGAGNLINNATLEFNRNDLSVVSNTISGTGSLTQAGLGTLMLSGSNSYTGSTSIISGVLSVNTIGDAGMNTSIGNSSSAINISFGTTLRYTGSGNTSSRQIALGTGGGTLDASGSGLLTLSGGVTGTNANLVLTGTGTGILNTGVIATGSGTLTKSGAGTWTLSGANTYTGATSISAGTLSINTLGNSGADTSLGNTSSAINISGGGTLQYTGAAASSLRPIVLSTGGGMLDASGSGLLTLSGGVTGSGHNLTLTGTGTGALTGAIATGSGTLTKDGSGTWTLSSTSSYTGATSINAGTLSINTIGNSGTNTAVGNSSGAINISGGGTLRYTGAATSSTRAITLGSGGGIVDASGSGLLTLSGGATGSGFGLTLTGSTTGTFSGVIGTGGGTLTKDGSGTWTLGNANTYTGATFINGGTLSVGTLANGGSNSSLGATAATTPVTLSGGGILSYTGAPVTIDRYLSTSTGGGTFLTTNTSISTPFVLSGNIDNANGLTLSSRYLQATGVISGAGNLTLTSSQTNARIDLTNALNSYTGQTIATHASQNGLAVYASSIADGGVNSALGATVASTPISLNNAGLLYTGGAASSDRQITMSGVSPYVYNLGSGKLTLNGNIATNATYATFDAGVNQLDLNGVISGNSSYIFFLAPANSTIRINNTANTFAGTARLTSYLYSGNVVITSLADAGVPSSLGAGTGDLFFVAGQDGPSTLVYTGGTTSTNRSISMEYYFGAEPKFTNASAGTTVTFTGGIDLGYMNFNFANMVGDVVLSGQVIGSEYARILTSGTGAGSLTINNNTNTFGGGVLVTGGILNYTSVSAINGGASALGSSDGTYGLMVGGTGILRYIGSSPATTNRSITLTSSGGTLENASSSALTFSGNVTGNTFGLNLSGTGNGTLSGIIGTTTGGLTKSGSGTWTLGNANTYTGATSITGGTLSVGTLANSGSNSSLGAGATAISLSGGGILSYTGATTSTNRQFATSGTGGTIQNTTANTLTLSGAIDNSGSDLTLNTTNSSGNITASNSSNSISGAGSLTKSGTGTLTLSGLNSYTGATFINSGTLVASNASSLGSGATQSSSTTIASGATLSLQTSLSNTNQITLSGIGNGSLSALVNTTFTQRTLSNPLVLAGNTTIGGSFGELILTGNVTESSVGSILTKTGNSVIYLRGDNSFTGATNVSQGMLAITSANGLGSGLTQSNGINVTSGASLYFDAAITLNNTSTITLAGTGVAPSFGALTYASGSGGNVILNNPITLASNINIGAANGGGSDHLVLNGNITGAFSITKEGLIALDLNGNNSYSGGTTINGSSFGRIEVGHASALGTGPININSGGLLEINLNNTALANNNTITIGSGGGYLLHNGTGSLTVNNPITLNTGSSLSINALPGSSNFDITNNITNNNASISVNNYTLLGAVNGDVTLSGVIGNGSGSLTKAGTGTTLILSNNNLYTGTTTISAGTLQVGNGSTSGSLGTGAVTNNAALSFNRSNSYIVSNAIGGTGTLTQSGAGTVILANDNNYSGITTISSGILQIGNGGANGTLGGGAVTNNAALAFNRNNAFTVSNVISGSGTLTQMGSGSTLTLSGLNTYSGGTTLSVGSTLELGVSSQVVSGNITAGPVGTGTLTMNGGSLMATNGQTRTLDNAYTVNGSVNIAQSSGSIIFNGLGTLASGTFTDNSFSTIVINGNLSGAGNLTANTSSGGLRILSPDNSAYIGTTTLSTGFLEIGAASNALGSGLLVLNNTGGAELRTFGTQVTLGNDFSVIGGANITSTSDLIMTGNGTLTSGSLTISNTNNAVTTFTGAISGANDLIQNSSAGTVILTGSNSYANTTITSGTLQIGNGGTTGTLGSGTVTNNNALIVDRSNDITIANLINGSGTLTKNGAGILSITNANGYTGLTTVNAGTLSVGNNTSLGTNTLTLNAGTILQTEVTGVTLANDIILGGSSSISNNGLNFILSGDIDGANILTLNGAGTTTIDGAIGGTTNLTGVTANSDLIINGGGVTTTGDQLYANDVTLGNTTTFANDGVGSQNITFNGALNTGTSDVTLSGTNSGSYQFTLNDINATSSTITVSAAPASTNNSLILNTGGAQDFVLTSNNTGTIGGITNVTGFNFNNIHNLNGGSGGLNSITAANTPNIWNISANDGGSVTNLTSFSNMQDLIGGTNSDIFNFVDGVTISGTVDGGDANDDSNHFDFGTIQDSLMLTLNMPILNVFDAGEVRSSSSALIVSFSQIQRAIGYGNGFITLPNTPNLKLFADTRPQYANNPKYGAIGDPFYFSNWTIGNPPPPIATPTPAPGNTFNTPIAAIVNQPVTNSYSNNNYSPTNYAYDPTVVNQTYVSPLLNTTVVNTGPACYTTGQ